MKRKIIIILLTTMLFSCQNKSSELIDKLATAEQIKAEIISKKNDILSEPLRMVYSDSLLIYSTENNEKMIECFNIDKKKVITDFIDRGNGPNELMMIGSFNISDKSNIYVYDIIKKSVYELKVDSGILREQITLKESGYQAFFVEDNEFCISNGIFPDGRFKLYKDGKLIDTYKKFPTILKQNNDTIFLNMAYQNFSSISPDGNKFANIVFNSEIIEGYSIIKGKIQNNWLHEWSMEPVSRKTIGDGDMAIQSENSFGFKNLAVSDKYVYATYSEKSIKETSPMTANGKYLFVFDWSGNLKKTFLLDYSVRTIAVSQDGQYLFATAIIENDVKILRYKLNITYN